ncbi:hypothetical protein TcBrA4_0135760 [Trypanosoma cruzi]|nr:hypothetical protein TcBrA4_0135760 [Trypanosoma cruzi]
MQVEGGIHLDRSLLWVLVEWRLSLMGVTRRLMIAMGHRVGFLMRILWRDPSFLRGICHLFLVGLIMAGIHTSR